MKMRFKKIIAFLTVAVLTIGTLVGCSTTKKEEGTKELQTVRLNEVVRSVFYAPMYIAINEGLFEEEGISIDLSTGQGADATLSFTQQLSTIIYIIT